jgi:HD-GYP domain-containing protein (c-di-GMP phosphodiesterase class II)
MPAIRLRRSCRHSPPGLNDLYEDAYQLEAQADRCPRRTGTGVSDDAYHYKEVAVAEAADTAVLEGDSPPPATATQEAPATRPLVLAYALPEDSRARLARSDQFDVVDDHDRAATADLVLVSTRIPRGRAEALIGELRAETQAPIVALAHHGGERVAVELLSAGGVGVVAEGNEAAIAGYLELGSPRDERLVDAYEQNLDRAGSGGGRTTRDRDPVTLLPGQGALEARLAAASGTIPLPRLGFANIRGFEDLTRRFSVDASEMVQRRIARQFREECRHVGAAIYSLDNGGFAVIAEDLSLAAFEALGRRLGTIAASFSPDRSAPLSLAMGHAGPESTSEVAALRELAHRGLEFGMGQPGGGIIVGADLLAHATASITEFNAAMEAVATIEVLDPVGMGHCERVGTYAAGLAEVIGIEGREATRVRLAAQVHVLGKLGLPEEVLRAEPRDLTGGDLDAYQQHPARGADLLMAAAGPAVADIVRSHHEHWDGSGFPDGLTGEEIPLGSRIVAVADALDRWSQGQSPSTEAVAKISEAAGTTFDPAVVDACRRLFG